VTIQSISKNRPSVWEDEVSAEPRLRRVQQGVPPTGRALPGMPLEMSDPENDDLPRLGEQRFAPKRTPWWRPASTAGRIFLALFLMVVLGGLATSAYFLKTWLGRDGRFRIAGASNIEASGLTEVSRAQMLPVFGEDIGRNIFFVPLSERRKQLEEIPWIEKATVMRLLPDQIRVSVIERQPVAFVRDGQKIGLVDASGVLLTMPAAMMAQHNYSFPVVTGISSHDSLVERKARMAVYQRLLGELDANGQHISEQISEIDLSDTEDAQVLMPEQGSDILAHFGEDRFLERYQRYKAHVAEWRQQYPKLTGVDLRYDQKVVLEMASGTDVAKSAADEQAAANADQSKPSDAQGTGQSQAGQGAPDKQPAGTKMQADHSLSTAKAKPGKPGEKPGVQAPAKAKTVAAQKNSKTPRTTAAKARAAQIKKRAEAKRAALRLNKQKTAPTAHPAVSAGQGQ